MLYHGINGIVKTTITISESILKKNASSLVSRITHLLEFFLPTFSSQTDYMLSNGSFCFQLLNRSSRCRLLFWKLSNMVFILFSWVIPNLKIETNILKRNGIPGVFQAQLVLQSIFWLSWKKSCKIFSSALEIQKHVKIQ